MLNLETDNKFSIQIPESMNLMPEKASLLAKKLENLGYITYTVKYKDHYDVRIENLNIENCSIAVMNIRQIVKLLL